MKNNTFTQLCLKYQEAIQPIWNLYTRDPDDCYDTIDGPQRIFMDSYELCEALRYVAHDEQVSAENKTDIKKFVDLRTQLDKLGDGPNFSLIDALEMSADEREEAWNGYYNEVIPVMQELLEATPPFVRAMYAYNGKTAPASV